MSATSRQKMEYFRLIAELAGLKVEQLVLAIGLLIGGVLLQIAIKRAQPRADEAAKTISAMREVLEAQRDISRDRIDEMQRLREQRDELLDATAKLQYELEKARETSRGRFTGD